MGVKARKDTPGGKERLSSKKEDKPIWDLTEEIGPGLHEVEGWFRNCLSVVS